MPSGAADLPLSNLMSAVSTPLARSPSCKAVQRAELAAAISGREYIGRLAVRRDESAASRSMRTQRNARLCCEFRLDHSRVRHQILAGEAGWMNRDEVRRDEPSPCDLAVTPKHEA